jgi:(1->4)-alpha-D-glucan 1-alpha-D-glucosylmutase
VLDIVPNHMGVGGSDNSWWLSVLEWGELSPYGRAFDIDWERLGANRNLVIPFLGDRYGEALEKGELKLSFDPKDGRFSVWHWEHCFPISPLSYPIVLDRALAALPEGDTQQGSELLAISERLRAMEAEAAPERRAQFPEEAEALRARLAAAVAGSEAVRQAIERAISLINGSPGTPESFGTLHRILEAQSYRLAHWRVAASDINYRRFFDINGLAGLRIEDPDIFERSHAAIFRLVREGRIQGLRIDHIDGLADPEAYVRALQGAVGPGFYIVIEKILEPGEALRPWPVAGTTGYDALNLLDGVFVESRTASRFESIYRTFTGLEGRYEALLLEAKTEILERSFASELEVLVSDLKRIADANRRTRDYTVLAIRQALIEIIARFPVYRSYLGDSDPTPEDWALIQETVEAAKRMSGLPDRTVHDFAAATLLGRIETGRPGLPDPDLVRRFRRRFQQLTGPVMAKSLEDTLFYRYGRLLSLNEVGGDPSRFGTPADEFHRANLDRQREWPHAMIATATHDTKRGEDARARLNALSEIPEEWQAALDRWKALASPYLTSVDGNEAPDANDLYLILQSVLGAWPLELLDEGSDREEPVASFRTRMEEYILKALREAKRHTSWVHGNEAYESAALGLLRGILAPGSEFLSAFRPLATRLAHLGMLTSLGRTILKCTIPGVPDTYQGTELWDFSLVDPDNRRPVDYEERERLLEDEADASRLMASWRSGAIKQRLIRTILADRAASPGLYDHGDYQPLRNRGDEARHVLAFLRTSGSDRLAVVVPRLLAGLVTGEGPPDASAWGETRVSLPGGRWRDVVTGREIEVDGDGVQVSELFREIPISVMRGQP